MTLEAGMVVGGDFRLDARLREGGMGQVWIAEQLSLGRKRALKVMRGELLADAKLRERFALEARVGATIDSDHVVEVVATGIDDKLGIPWLAMELLEGGDLEAAIEERGGLPWAEVAQVATQLGHALAAAHAVGVVHRDLKPENVFLARSRRSGSGPFDVKVLDFGIAKLVEGMRATSAQSALIGTPLYMAPEQTETSGLLTPGIDVWAVGLVAYRALTGHCFWRSATGPSSSVTSMLRELLIDPIPLASERASALDLGSRLPAGFDAWFSRCVARDPGARFPEGGEACDALAAILEGSAEEEGSRERSRAPVRGEPSVNMPAALQATVFARPPHVEVLHEDPVFSIGRVADIIAIRWWQTPSVACVQEMDRTLTLALNAAEDRWIIMPVVDTSVAVPTAAARSAIEDMIKRHDAAVDRVTYVVLGAGFQAATLRAVMIGIVLAKRPQHSTKVYASVRAALASLAPRSDRPEVAALLPALERFAARVER